MGGSKIGPFRWGYRGVEFVASVLRATVGFSSHARRQLCAASRRPSPCVQKANASKGQGARQKAINASSRHLPTPQNGCQLARHRSEGTERFAALLCPAPVDGSCQAVMGVGRVRLGVRPPFEGNPANRFHAEGFKLRIQTTSTAFLLLLGPMCKHCHVVAMRTALIRLTPSHVQQPIAII